MVGCDKCKSWFLTDRALKIHKIKAHTITYVPDLIKLGVVKRKLIRIESSKITKEVMDMKLKGADARFMMAVIKAIDITQKYG